MRRATLLLMAMTLAGCAAGSASPSFERVQFYFPRHADPLGAGDAARLEGTTAFADGCLWIETEAGDRFLPLWPSDTTAGEINDLPAVLGPDSELLVETGSLTVLGGSQTDLATAAELVGAIPAACASDAFWAVSTVESRP